MKRQNLLDNDLCFRQINSSSGILAGFVLPVCISKSNITLCVAFSGAYNGLYKLFVNLLKFQFLAQFPPICAFLQLFFFVPVYHIFKNIS